MSGTEQWAFFEDYYIILLVDNEIMNGTDRYHYAK